METFSQSVDSDGIDEFYSTNDTSGEDTDAVSTPNLVCMGVPPEGLYENIPIPTDTQSIRLLRLLPGGWHDDIHCEMRTVSLAKHPKYETLSYTWGNVKTTETIYVNNISVQVTTNLRAALRYLRKSSSSLTLWVDAICINQSSTREKSQQVRLMSSIYKKCSQVYAFLGPHTSRKDTSDFPQPPLNPFIFLRLLSRSAHQHIHEFNSIQLVNTTGITSYDTVDAGEIIQDALESIVKSEWWERMWTIQEIVLPRTAKVVCGQWMIPWTSLVSYCVRWLTHTPDCCNEHRYPWTSKVMYTLKLLGKRCQDLEEIRNHVAQDGNRLDVFYFSELLTSTLDKKCRDPRDKVFSLLGLFNDAEDEILQPNYSQSAKETYEKAVAKVAEFRQENPLFVLSPAFRSPSSAGLSLPSWIPDFSLEADHNFVRMRRDRKYTFQANYNASKGHASTAIIDSGEFFEVGIHVDTVATVNRLPTPFVPTNITQWFNFVRLTQEALHKDKHPGTNKHDDNLLLSFWRALQGDLKTAKQDFTTWRRLSKQDLREEDAWRFEASLKAASPSSTNGILDDYSHMPLIVDGRALFLTRTGRRWGFGVPEVQPGDEIWILYGSPVPFILRPPVVRYNEDGVAELAGGAGSRNARPYSFVGDCYLDGVMFGEALVNSVFKEEIVVLR